MINIINIFFESDSGLAANKITPYSIYSMFLKILQEKNGVQSKLLHDHPSPKPFSIAFFYSENNEIAGIRISILSKTVYDPIQDAILGIIHNKRRIRIGDFRAYIEDVEESQVQWEDLVSAKGFQNLTLRFHTPTCFRKGSYCLQLPVPNLVFNRPHLAWTRYAPNELDLPSDLLDWLEHQVFVIYQKIQTLKVPLSSDTNFIGFTGDVEFHAQKGPGKYLQAFHTLGNFSEYTGIGYKTSMGMGVVEKIHR